MMLKIMIYSLAAMLGLFSSNLLAEGGAYQIEMIVFSQAMPTTEVFEQSSSQISWPSALTELSAYKKPDNTTLADSYSALSKDSAYQPISHIAWIQPVAAGGGIAPVHIQSADGKLNGYLQMQQEQGLHMMVDFELVSNPGEMIYRLTEKRQVKLNEVHYLDHPRFGIVVKISPF